ELYRCIRWTASHRLRNTDAVESLALQMFEHILRSVICRTPARIAFISNVHMHVDHRRHDGLSCQIHTLGTFRWRHISPPAYGCNSAVLDDKCAVVNRWASAANDQPGPIVKNSDAARCLGCC